MTIKESIEKLGKKLTGKDIHGTSISDVVSKVGDNFEGGSGGVVFNIYFTEEAVFQDAEKTPSEVEQLLSSGANVSCNVYIGGTRYQLLTMEMSSVRSVPEDEDMPGIIAIGIHPCGYLNEVHFAAEDDIFKHLPMVYTGPEDTWTIYD